MYVQRMYHVHRAHNKKYTEFINVLITILKIERYKGSLIIIPFQIQTNS